ncbi:unnamed protein product [Linum trigynum]|uniref:Uncharacterized protein n=1 Tax=Linum trigynum TaxID=586398 RepID=A0AAV2CD41_9ROSI
MPISTTFSSQTPHSHLSTLHHLLLYGCRHEPIEKPKMPETSHMSPPWKAKLATLDSSSDECSSFGSLGFRRKA